MILLTLRTLMKEDIKASPAELVYGTNLTLPADLVIQSDSQPTIEFITNLKNVMNMLIPNQTSWHRDEKPFVPADISTCKYVFLRNDSVKPSHTRPYDGPYEVINRSDKLITISAKNRHTTVSIDRVKPAYIDDSS